MVVIGSGPTSHIVLYADDPTCEGRRFPLVALTEDEAEARRNSKREEWRISRRWGVRE